MANGDAAGPRTRVEATVEALRNDIVDGVHAPGTKLAVEHLRERYGVGSSTVREALSHLVPDGLVTGQGQRGYTVSPISIVDLQDLSQVRTMLETYALRESITHGNDEWEASIVAAFHRLTKAQRALEADEPGAVADWEARNHDFHDALTSACPSRWVHHMLDMLHHHSERYRRIALTDRSVPRDVHTEHQELMNAVLDRDVDRAAAVVSDHIRRTADVIAVLYSDRIEPVGTDDAA